MTCDPIREELSPDGRTLVRWAESDGRMSHVIRTPTILDAAGGETILRFGDSGYDGAIVWGADGGFEIDLRHYWREGSLRLEVDRAGGIFRRLDGGGEGPSCPLGEISDYVEDYFIAAGAGRDTGMAAAEQAGAESWRRGRLSFLWAFWLSLPLGLGAAIWVLFFQR